jgi:hypothetical protein
VTARKNQCTITTEPDFAPFAIGRTTSNATRTAKPALTRPTVEAFSLLRRQTQPGNVST